MVYAQVHLRLLTSPVIVYTMDSRDGVPPVRVSYTRDTQDGIPHVRAEWLIRGLNPNTCLRYYVHAVRNLENGFQDYPFLCEDYDVKNGLRELQEKAFLYALDHASDVMATKEFLSLSKEHLIKYIAQHNLKVKTEDEAAEVWHLYYWCTQIESISFLWCLICTKALFGHALLG